MLAPSLLGRRRRDPRPQCARPQPIGSKPPPLQLEALELRFAPACALSGQTVNCDFGNDNVEVRIDFDAIKIYDNASFLGNVSDGTVTVNGGGGANAPYVND